MERSAGVKRNAPFPIEGPAGHWDHRRDNCTKADPAYGAGVAMAIEKMAKEKMSSQAAE
jgi:hypothetical protein